MNLREPIGQLIRDPREFTRHLNFPDPSQLRVYDETLRDGEQMPGVCYTPEQKFRIAKELAAIGVHILGVGFPAASAGDRKTLQLVMEGKRKGDLGNVEIVVMCRSNRKDIDVTVDRLPAVGVSQEDVTFFIFTSGSDLHLKYKIGKTLVRFEGKDEKEWLDLPLQFFREANIRLQCDAIRYARDRGVTSIEFGAEDGSRGDVDYFIEYFKAGLAAGGNRPAWPDTVGCLTPEATRWYCTRIVDAMPKDVPLLNHFHNDYGLGTINCIEALASGFRVFSVTANGYGERAGNVPLHQVMTALNVLYGIEIPGFKYHKLRELARFMERMSGIPVQQHEPIIGEKVFAHESGIHTHAMLIDRRMYEAVPAALVGAEMSFVFGKHSGVSIVEDALRKHEPKLSAAGVSIDSDLVTRVTNEVKRLREERAQSSKSEETIETDVEAMRQLSIAEAEVADIAIALGSAPGPAARVKVRKQAIEGTLK